MSSWCLHAAFPLHFSIFGMNILLTLLLYCLGIQEIAITLIMVALSFTLCNHCLVIVLVSFFILGNTHTITYIYFSNILKFNLHARDIFHQF